MTTMPQPADPTQSYTATYDAWNRLVKLEEGGNPISRYQYDGAKRRIVQISGSGLSSLDTRHFYYTQPSQWQVVEERVGTSPDSADAERQFVWGLRYIDDCVLRDRDANNDGTLDERLYAMQDANWNVTGITNDAGAVQERYAYAAYGTPVFLSAAFVPQSAAFDWESLYCGYRYESGTGLFHVRNRVYHPILGTWVQRDPLGLSDAPNLYLYAISNPISNSDESGLLAVLLGPAVILAFVMKAIMTVGLLCATGFLTAFFTDLFLQIATCMARRCLRFQPQWPPIVPAGVDPIQQGLRCIGNSDPCSAAISGIIGCIANVAAPGIGAFGGILAGIARNLTGQLMRKIVTKMLATMIGNKLAKQLCP